ncbi:membrane protein [Prevotella melaninogenica]|uniref:Membrane protein n=2 Tax=Prevotella melaninogenica TaxID=28132 RepID=A0A250KQW7_9BACT|nr:membrane protein [Prevotella melaninogenica]
MLSCFFTTFAEKMKKGLLYIVLTFILSVVNATAGVQSMTNPDSIQISLLTCSPGKEVWAQYGHTAIRYYDKESGEDLAINYGIFSLDQTYFIPRFVLGMTDYRMGVQPMDIFLAQYSYEGRGVVEQVLNLSAEDKEVIYKALQENMKPENVVYRYNYFFDNCTTRARDMLANHLHGKIVYPPAEEDATFRSMIHKWNNKYKWSQFGEDLLLGVNADRKTTKSEQQFLPENLRSDFDKARYNGKPLVKETNVLLDAETEVAEPGFPLSPLSIALIFAVISLVMMLFSYRRQQVYWAWDLVLMLTSGLMGIIFFIMIFSQHPCVSLNFNLFFFNPLPLFFLYSTLKKKKVTWWKIWGVLIILGLFGSLFQEIPLPILIVASFLLLHCIVHLRINKAVATTVSDSKK